MDLLNLLLSSMTTQSSVDSVKAKTGLSSKQIKMLIAIALPILLKYLTKNASSESGASSLLSALGQHKTEKPMATQIKEADEVDGDKILGHIFGSNQKEVTQQIAKESGIDAKDVAKVLAVLAPALLGGVSSATSHASNQKQQGINLADGIDMTDVIGLLGGLSQKPQQTQQTSTTADLLSALLGGQSKPQPTQQDNGAALMSALLSMMK